MGELNLPQYDIRMRTREDGRCEVWDILRRRYVALTPEEWVRQNFIQYLINEKGYPSALMANEVQITIGGKQLRCDSILYNKHTQPVMVMEYKAPTVAVSQKTFNQVVAYNQLLKVRYIIVSNGLHHYCCHINYDSMKVEFLNDIPEYGKLKIEIT